MDYSIKDAFKSLEELDDSIELKTLKEDLNEAESFEARLIWDDCTPTRERRPTTKSDIENDTHLEEFNSAKDLLSCLANLANYDEEDLADCGSTDIEKIKCLVNVFDDPGDGSANILFLKVNDEVLQDWLEECDGNTCSLEDVKEEQLRWVEEWDDEGDLEESSEELNEEELNEADEKINLKKYGFVRAPEEDFSDDGTRFFCYYYDPEGKGDKRIRLSKATYKGEVWLAARYHAPESGRSKHWDDLNGVSISAAIEGLPKLKADLDDFLKDTTDFDKVSKLDDETVKKLADEIKWLVDRAGLTEYQAEKRAYANLGIEYDTVPALEKRKLSNYLRNTKPYDKEELKKDVKSTIKAVLREMNSFVMGYGRNQTFHNAKDVDSAIEVCKYSLSKYPDEIQNKVKAHIKSKIAELFNFDVDKESLEEAKVNGKDFDIDAFADEIVLDLEKDGLVESLLNEEMINLENSEEVDKAKEELEKEQDEAPVEQIVDPAATVVDDLKDSYVGYAILRCPKCMEFHYVKPEEVVKSEEQDEDGKFLYNVDEECTRCFSKDGFNLIGQVAEFNETTEEEPKEEETEEEVEVKEEEPLAFDKPEKISVEEETIEEPANEALKEDCHTQDVIDWISEHDELYDDFKKHFNYEYNVDSGEETNRPSVVDIIDWLQDHEEAFADFKAHFKLKEDLEESEIDFDEKSFDTCVNKYLKEIYENVDSYETTGGCIDGNDLLVEGIIKFTSGKEKETSFKFTMNENKNVLIGLNEGLANEESAYVVETKLEDNTLKTIKFNYNYKIQEQLVEGFCDAEEKEALNESLSWDDVETALYSKEYNGPVHSEVNYGCLRGFESRSDACQAADFIESKFGVECDVERDPFDHKSFVIKVPSVVDESLKEAEGEDAPAPEGVTFDLSDGSGEPVEVTVKDGEIIGAPEELNEDVSKTVKFGVPTIEFHKVEEKVEECGFGIKSTEETKGVTEFEVVGDSSKEDCWKAIEELVADINGHTNVEVYPAPLDLEVTLEEEKSEEQNLEEASNGHEFEVVWFEGPSEEEAKRGDPITKKFSSKQEAMDYYNLINIDEDKFGFMINEWDENGELVDDIL